MDFIYLFFVGPLSEMASLLLRALPRGRSSGLLQRAFTTTAAADVSKEEAMRKVLQTKLTANFVKVEDVSGELRRVD